MCQTSVGVWGCSGTHQSMAEKWCSTPNFQKCQVLGRGIAPPLFLICAGVHPEVSLLANISRMRMRAYETKRVLAPPLYYMYMFLCQCACKSVEVQVL